MGKRIFDITVSFIGFCVLLPVFLIIMLLVVIFDGMTPFFIQERVGKSGSRFRLYKFRTMKQAMVGQNKDFDVGNLSRITLLGKILRKTKFDELPQLVNVLKGDMSLVGPRPEVGEWTVFYPEKWEVVHRVRPGITDYASLEFHNEEELLVKEKHPDAVYRDVILPRKLELNMDYVNNRTFLGDVKILLKTIKLVWVA